MNTETQCLRHCKFLASSEDSVANMSSLAESADCLKNKMDIFIHDFQ